jgi:hypothetical protein
MLAAEYNMITNKTNKTSTSFEKFPDRAPVRVISPTNINPANTMETPPQPTDSLDLEQSNGGCIILVFEVEPANKTGEIRVTCHSYKFYWMPLPMFMEKHVQR